MKEFRVKIIINGSAAEVWRVLHDASAYAKFDPSCVSIDGTIKLGEKLSIRTKEQPKRVFKVTVSKLDKNIMIWQSSLPLNLFSGVRVFEVIAKDDKTSEFHMHEKFSGLLLKIFKNMIPDLSENFNQFARGLKRHIESRS